MRKLDHESYLSLHRQSAERRVHVRIGEIEFDAVVDDIILKSSEGFQDDEVRVCLRTFIPKNGEAVKP